MDNKEIMKHVDHTLLAAVSTWDEIERLCDDAVKYGTASVCVPPSYIDRINKKYGDSLVICTVIGFPLGYNCVEVKVAEARIAIDAGAKEVDMVVNLGDVKNGDFDKITDEIRALKVAANGNILKVIVETCYLTEEEKIALCKCVTNSGADYIKTSTGFGTGGATIEDIKLFKKHIGSNVKIKAAGGIRTKEDMVAFLDAGADRLGTSSAVKILSGEAATGY